jgi:hypothetical protein
MQFSSNSAKLVTSLDDPAAREAGATVLPSVARFVRMGEAEERLTLLPGTTLGDVLTRRGLDLASGDVFYNLARSSDPETVVEPGSLIVYTSKIRGGAATLTC